MFDERDGDYNLRARGCGEYMIKTFIRHFSSHYENNRYLDKYVALVDREKIKGFNIWKVGSLL